MDDYVCAIGRLRRGENEGKDKRDQTYEAVNVLIDSFENEFKGHICRELIDGCDFSTEEGLNRFESGGYFDRCCGFVEFVARQLEKMLD